MNKFLTFLATGFIAILGVFSVSGKTKNAAEPQYFLENKEIQNAAVDKSTETNNIIDFYFDSNTNFYNQTESPINLITIDTNTEVYYYNENGTLVNANYSTQEFDILKFEINELETDYYLSGFTTKGLAIIKYNQNINEDGLNFQKNQWYITLDFINIIKIKGFRIINFEYFISQNLNTINSELSQYIGNLTELEQPPTPTNSLDQIGNIISDTIDWFVNIFSGLSNVFYNNGNLSVWGNVLFIGVAIYLVSMCLVWVISLIKGV